MLVQKELTKESAAIESFFGQIDDLQQQLVRFHNVSDKNKRAYFPLHRFRAR
jgi:hypothetical protein